MAWDNDLTDEQKRAAAHEGAHARLLAGPGTGKTRALTRHAMFLVESLGIPPEERNIIQKDLKAILGLERIKQVSELLHLLSADWEKRFPNPQFLGAWQEHRKIFGYTLRSELVYQLKLAFTEGKLTLKDPPQHLLVDE